MAETKRRTRYHHGDLRQALVDAGLRIIERDGLDGLTLRRVAAEAGVSHAAPAHHFPHARDLIAALATVAFERFEASMREARAGALPDPASQMRAAGDGYLAFALANSGLFRLMFDASRRDLTEALGVAADRAHAQLREICAPAVAAGALGLNRQEIETLVWSSIHGFASLAIDGKMGPPDAGGCGDPPDVARLLFPERAPP